jgi:hypothetical protein
MKPAGRVRTRLASDLPPGMSPAAPAFFAPRIRTGFGFPAGAGQFHET